MPIMMAAASAVLKIDIGAVLACLPKCTRSPGWVWRNARNSSTQGAPESSSQPRASPTSSSSHMAPGRPALRAVPGPPTLFTIPVLRYMKTYELTHETLAMVSVVQREWAAKNPRATFKTPITVDDVLNSRMIAYPFRLLQCCLVTDGGGALVLVAAERAKDFPQKPVYLLGTGESVETPMVSQMEDF